MIFPSKPLVKSSATCEHTFVFFDAGVRESVALLFVWSLVRACATCHAAGEWTSSEGLLLESEEYYWGWGLTGLCLIVEI